MLKNLFNNIIPLYKAYDFHLRTALWADQRIHLVDQFYQSRPAQGTLPIVIVFEPEGNPRFFNLFAMVLILFHSKKENQI